MDSGDREVDLSKPHVGVVADVKTGEEYDLYLVPNGVAVAHGRLWAVKLPRVVKASDLLPQSRRLQTKARVAGVYMIYNSDTGFAYIGSSGNVYQRLREHRGNLKRGEHRSPRLQNSYTSRGGAGFSFLLVEELPAGTPHEELIAMENYYLLRCGRDSTYNTSFPAQIFGVPPGFKHTEEQNARKRQMWVKKLEEGFVSSNRGKKKSEEDRRHQSERQRELGVGAGENNSMSKLTWEKVREIRKFYAELGGNYGDGVRTARHFGVEPKHVNLIVSGRRWKEKE